MHYRAEIDGLRAVAVVPVILFHAGFKAFSGGYVGVDVFFVISGYLITSLILTEKTAGTFSLVNFYERRARRLLPALFFVMAVCIPLAWLWLLPGHMKDFAQTLVAVPSFSSNILFWLKSGYFDTAAELKPLLHTWSLAVEEQYYVLFPLFLILTWRIGNRPIVVILAVIALLSLGIAQWGSTNQPTATFYLLPTRSWELLIGALVAFYLIEKREIKGNQILSLLGMSMVAYSIFAFDEYTPFPSFYTLVPTVGVALIILFTSSTTLAHKFLSNRLCVGVGLISYSAYLWHVPLFAFARHRSMFEPSAFLMIGLAFASIALAYFTWRYVEKPFRDRERFNQKQIFSASIVLSSTFILIGVYAHLQNGNVGYLASNESVQSRSGILRTLNQERLAGIRAGTCHFDDDREGYRNIDDFVSNWGCFSDDEAGLINTKTGVYGDSHSADIVSALRLNGVDVLQVTGDDCPLIPAPGQASYCNMTLATFQRAALQQKIETVILANRFTDDELTGQYLLDLFDYWTVRYPQVVVFSPIPQFYSLQENYIKFGRQEAQVSFKKSDEFFRLLGNISVPSNVIIVDTGTILCGREKQCPISENGDLLYTDSAHLSTFGASYFGESLIHSESWRQIQD